MISESVFFEYGYAGLFAISFLSATLLPLASEAFVAMMPTLGYNVWWVLVFAAAGNYLGSLTNYYIGKWGGNFALARFIRPDEEKAQRARKIFRRWGTPVLFFSWVPVIGDPLAVVGGIMDVRLVTFTLWVLSGKMLRYLVILGVVQFVV
jgi:membrane protein YqaA with SNARE-associated domain